ncbi:MAG: DUF2807 domain-containing protein [Alphaproteobacteria bacterium]|nr:DUF2807 domain-containing protein [Alphaproteobacteria bacterium]
MSRALFMAKLEEGLAGLPQTQIDEIVSDYRFHFAEAEAAGQSEDDIVARLGDPARLAEELRGENEPCLAANETPKSAGPAVMASPGGQANRWWLLAFLAVAGGGMAVYYLAGHDGRGPTMIANVVPPAPASQAPIAPAHGVRVVISGGQVLDLGNIAQERIEILLDGGGRATAKGRVAELTLHIDGSGSADLGNLEADNVRVDVSGTGSADVSGTQMVDVTIMGSGTVRLRKKPRTLMQSVTGPGQVILPSGQP